MPGIGEARLAEADHLVGDDAVLAVVDQRDGDARTQPSSRAAPIASASLRRQRSSSTVSGRNVTTLTVSEEGSTGRISEIGRGGERCGARRGASGRIVEE